MTELEYMLNTYNFESEATIVDIWNNEFWNYIILDKTIFYPQWWWQPTDTWVMASWDTTVDIVNVRADATGKIFHYILWNNPLNIWDQITSKIDKNVRIFNARNHSAGHLIDIAISNIWYPNFQPTRWHHFPDGSYVSYDGILPIDEREEFKNKLQQELDTLISKDITMQIDHENLENKQLPTKSTRRHAHFEWYSWCWCGWTHIKSTWEIWKITIRKVSCKKWSTKISYEIRK